ncbi:MAG: hypothetical protein EPN34_06265 [Burkholderiaceae bacterium]|nr:MAG: hypothetical protein EPN34_06265 [Burkholderiaceae bacterium]
MTSQNALYQEYPALWHAYARIFDALDENKSEEFVDCFTSEGVIFVQGRGETRGRELQHYIARTASGRPCHHFTNFLVTAVSDAKARARANFVLVGASDGELYARGHTDDSLEKGSDGNWRFSGIQFLFNWASVKYRSGGRVKL